MLKAIVFLSFLALVITQNPWDPTPRPDQWWVDRHNEFVQNTQQNASDIQIVFLGSSSIEMWGSVGSSLWNSKYAPLGAVNYGIGGDSIQHCLWRITNGELEGLNPKMLVLYCGSNNVWSPATADITRGISTTLQEIRARLPNTTILYLAINPRGDMEPVTEIFNRSVTINSAITSSHDGVNGTVVFNMFNNYILSWGVINQGYFLGDKIHLNAAGYNLWDRLWNTTFHAGLN